MSSVNKENFVFFFFSNLYTFYFISCPISLAVISSTVLRKSGEDHPCLIADLSRKALNLKYDVSCRFLKDTLYQVEEVLNGFFSNANEKFMGISLICNLEKLQLD